MATWSAFYPYTSIYTTGLPNPVIDHHIRLACIDFCTRAMVWRQTLDDVPTVSGQRTYDFPFDTRQELVQLVSASLNGEDLDLVGLDAIDAKGFTDCRTQALYAVDRLQFALTELPAASGLTIKVKVTLKPSLTATGVSDDVFATYAQAISKGALATLMLLPGETSSPGLSDRMSGQFEQAITDAAFSPDRSFTRAPLRVRMI